MFMFSQFSGHYAISATQKRDENKYSTSMNYRKNFGSCGAIYDRVQVISAQNLAKHDLRCPRFIDNTASQNIFFQWIPMHAANSRTHLHWFWSIRLSRQFALLATCSCPRLSTRGCTECPQLAMSLHYDNVSIFPPLSQYLHWIHWLFRLRSPLRFDRSPACWWFERAKFTSGSDKVAFSNEMIFSMPFEARGESSQKMLEQTCCCSVFVFF